jgi:hypothetical protein
LEIHQIPTTRTTKNRKTRREATRTITAPPAAARG